MTSSLQADHFEGIEHRNSGQDRLHTLFIRPAGDADDRVPGTTQRGPDDGTDASRADDPDAEPSVAPHDRSSSPATGADSESGADDGS